MAERGARGWYRRGAFGLAFGLIPLLVLSSPSLAADKLRVIGAPTEPLRVRLEGPEGSTRKGVLSTQIRNVSHRRGRLRIRYFPDDGPHSIVLSRRKRKVFRGLSARLGRHVRRYMAPQDINHVAIHFTAKNYVTPSALSGLVVAELRVRRRPRAADPTAETAMFRIQAVRAAPRDVEFVPSEATLSVTRLRPGGMSGNHAEVTLRGDGVSGLMAALRKRELSTVVNSSNGGSAMLTLSDARHVDGEGRMTLAARDITKEGRYEAAIPLAPAADDSPELSVAVNAHDWFWWGVLTLFGGAVAGLVVTRLMRLYWRRGTLESGLSRALQRYEINRDRYKHAPKWTRLDNALGKPPWYGPRLKCDEFPASFGAANLICRIRSARSDADLTNDEQEAKLLVDRTERWSWLAEDCDALAKDLSDVPPPRGTHSFDWRPIYKDARMLLSEASEEKATHEEMESFGEHLTEERAALAAAKVVWRLQADLDAKDSDLSDEEHMKVRALDLPVLETGHDMTHRLTPSQLRALKGKLDDAEVRLRAMRVQLEEEPTLLSAAVSSASESVATVTKPARRVIGAAVAVCLYPFKRARDVWLGLRRLARADWLSTLTSAGVATVAYMLLVYNDTWGSRTDYLSAFTVGFLGKFGFDWGTQLIFQSRRLGSTGG